MDFRLCIPRRWPNIFPVAFLALLLTSCFWPAEEEAPLSFTLPATFSDVPLAVGSQTYAVARGEIVRTIAFNGIVQAGTQRELYFTVNGPVTALHIENGAQVYPGDLLIELDAEEASLDVAQARLIYRQAELNLLQTQTGKSYALEVAQLNLEIAQLRLDKLSWNPNTPREDIEVAQREVDLARSAVTQAEGGTDDATQIDVTIAEIQLQMADLALKRAERDLASLQLVAPITGTIRLGQELRVGYPVEAYAAIARLVDPSSLVIESNLAADDEALLFEGMSVQLEVNALPGITFPGQITQLPQPYGNGSTPVTQIAPDLTNSTLTLREGGGVTIRAEVGRRDDALWLPNRTIQTVAGQAYVVVREGDRLRDQAIQVGLIGDERTEIVSGLDEGMQVMGP